MRVKSGGLRRFGIPALLTAAMFLALAAGGPLLPREGTAGASGGRGAGGSGPATEPVPASRWHAFRGGPDRCGWTTGPSPVVNTVLWSYDTGAFVEASPVFGGGLLYIPSDNGRLYALDPRTGNVSWQVDLGDGATMESSACYDSGVVYVGTQYGPGSAMYALNASNGVGIWTVRDDTGIASSPICVGGVVYYGSMNGSLMALNASSGALVWELRREGQIFSSPSVWNGLVYAGTILGEAFAAWAKNGTLAWNVSYPSPWTVYSSPPVSNGVVYFGFAAYTDPPLGELVALDAATGAVKWRFTEHQGDYCTPGVTNDALYVHVWNKTAGGGFCYAFPLDDPDGDGVMTIGDALWSFQTLDVEGGSSPLVTDNAIIVGSNYNLLFALNRTTGQEMWNITTRKSNVGSAAVWERKVYYGSKDGKLYCIGSCCDLVGMSASSSAERKVLISGELVNVTFALVDEAGNPVGGALVNFSATAGNLSAPNGTTGPDGRGTVAFTAQSVKKSTAVTLRMDASRDGMANASTTVVFTVGPVPVNATDPEKPAAIGPLVLGLVAIVAAAAVVSVAFLAIRRRRSSPPAAGNQEPGAEGPN